MWTRAWLAAVVAGASIEAGLPDDVAATGWRQVLETGWGRAAVVAGSGDVFVGGRLQLGQFEHGLIVLRLDATSGAEMWRHVVDGTDTPDCCTDATDDVAMAVTMLPGGDVVAAGLIDDAVTDDDFTVMRLDVTNGMEVWRQSLNTGTAFDAASAVAADAAGDVYAAGDPTVIKFNGATGAQVWTYDPTGMAANAVVVDAAGNVIVAGSTSGVSTVAKLNAATGTQIWSAPIPGSTSSSALGVAVDGAGDVLAAGHVDSGFNVTKLAGGSGAPLWTKAVENPGLALSVAVDPMNDVIAGGWFGSIPNDSLVVKLAAGTGNELWRHTMPGGNLNSQIHGVALEAAGNVLAGGQLGSSPSQVALKLNGADGSELWRQRVDGSHYGFAAAPNGDIVNTGIYPGGNEFLFAFRFANLDGSLGSVAGRSLSVIDAGSPRDPRIRFLAKDSGIAMPPPGSVGDPRVAGATLRLVNPTTLETATLALPGGTSWSLVGLESAPKAYVYRDGLGANGACSRVSVKRGKTMKAVCAGNLDPIAFTLNEPSQGSLAVTLQLGSAQPQCAVFGGDVGPDQTGRFRARNAPPIDGACP